MRGKISNRRHSHNASSIATGKGIAVALAFLAILPLGVHSQFPVLYPSPYVFKAFVEDKAADALLPVHGAFSKFFCGKEARDVVDSASGKCHEHIVHTNQLTTNYSLSWVGIDGQQLAFKHPPSFQVQSPRESVDISESVTFDTDNLTTTEVMEAEEAVLPPGTVAFSVAVTINQENQPLLLRSGVAGMTRGIIMVLDRTPPRVSIRAVRPSIPSSFPVAHFLIQFSERIVVSPSFRNRFGGQYDPYCNAKLLALSKQVTAVDMLLMSAKCNANLVVQDIRGVIQLSGVQEAQAEYRRESGRVLLVARLAGGVPVDVKVRIPAGSVMDYAGNVNELDGFAVAYYRPTVGVPSHHRTDRMRFRKVVLPVEKPLPEEVIDTGAAAALGTAATAMVAGSVAASGGGGGGGGGAGGGGGGSGGSPLDMISMAQKMYLTGLMAVTNFPENYGAFTSQMNWAVFDIDTPWDKAKERKEQLLSENITITATGLDDLEDGEEVEEDNEISNQLEVIGGLFEADNDEDPYDHLRRVFFWVPAIYAVLLALHSCCLCVCIFRRRAIPDILQFPRLEILFAYWAIPAVAVAAAGLFKGKRNDALFGTWLLVVFPVGFMVWNVYMLYQHFYSRDPTHRKANMVLVEEHLPPPVLKQYLTSVKRGLTSRVARSSRAVPRQPDTNKPGKKRCSTPVYYVNGIYQCEKEIEEDIATPAWGGKGWEGEGKLDELLAGTGPMHCKPGGNFNFHNPHYFSGGYGMGMGQEHREESSGSDARQMEMQMINNPLVFQKNMGDVMETWSALGDPAPCYVDMEIDDDPGELAIPVIAPQNPLTLEELSRMELFSMPGAHVDRVLLADAAMERDMELERQREAERRRRAEEKRLADEAKANAQNAGGCTQCLWEVCDFSCVSLLLGKHQPEGEWVSTTKANSKFIARFGPLFEDHRGHPVIRRRPTYAVHPITGRVDRGELITIKDRPLFRIPAVKIPMTNLNLIGRKKVYRFQLQILTRLLTFTKIILLGCLVGGINDEDNVKQVATLFIISCLTMLVVRIARPFPNRLDMGVTLLAEGADILTFMLGIVLLIGPSDDKEFRLKVGEGMLIAEGAAFLALVVERLIIALGACGWACGRIKKQQNSRFVRVVVEVMSKYQGFLERKYFDRWMVKALKRGLHNRPVKREELPVGVYLSMRFKRLFHRSNG